MLRRNKKKQNKVSFLLRRIAKAELQPRSCRRGSTSLIGSFRISVPVWREFRQEGEKVPR
jgi:hypothetical protein